LIIVTTYFSWLYTAQDSIFLSLNQQHRIEKIAAGLCFNLHQKRANTQSLYWNDVLLNILKSIKSDVKKCCTWPTTITHKTSQSWITLSLCSSVFIYTLEIRTPFINKLRSYLIDIICPNLIQELLDNSDNLLQLIIDLFIYTLYISSSGSQISQ
jgi:hypothetical protein